VTTALLYMWYNLE